MFSSQYGAQLLGVPVRPGFTDDDVCVLLLMGYEEL
jgi:hypothetical protein